MKNEEIKLTKVKQDAWKYDCPEPNCPGTKPVTSYNTAKHNAEEHRNGHNRVAFSEIQRRKRDRPKLIAAMEKKEGGKKEDAGNVSEP